MKAVIMIPQKQDQIQRLQLLEGSFTPSEANDVITSIIDKNINFYKLQHLSLWEKDHTISSDSVNELISELNFKKNNLKRIIAQAKETGSKLSIESMFEIKLVQ